jgi:hypothetical protein
VIEEQRPDIFWRRLAKYAVITMVIQAVLGMLLYSTLYGRGPLSLLFLIPMTNIGYLWLLQNAVSFRLWPVAMLIGSFFMFFLIFVLGEITHRLRRAFS